jgi:arylsulfotransferase ASST
MKMKKTTFTLILISLVVIFSIIAIVYLWGDSSLSRVGHSLEKLKSLPYLTWVSSGNTIEKEGVTLYDPERTLPGLNLYNPRNLSTAYLIDLSGNVLHSWKYHLLARDSWHHVELCKNGDLLVIIKDEMLIRLDWDSNLLWEKRLRFHHDIAIDSDDDIYSIIRKDASIPVNGHSINILNDYIVQLSPDGEIKKEISLFDLLKDEISPVKYDEILRWTEQNGEESEIMDQTGNRNKTNTPPDLFHTNTIEVLDREIEGVGGRGDLLISAREMNLIAVVDPEREMIVWSWGPGVLDKQHQPSAIPNGNILIFDNGISREYSRIVELDPRTGEIVWEYKADPEKDFFSGFRGGCQRLPNGNTLITESDKGRVFEVTPEGDTVWEFYNPEVNIEKKKRSAIYRMNRISSLEKYPRLKNFQITKPVDEYSLRFQRKESIRMGDMNLDRVAIR